MLRRFFKIDHPSSSNENLALPPSLFDISFEPSGRSLPPACGARIKKLNNPSNPDLALESYARFYSCSIRNLTNQSEFELEGGVRRTITDSVPSPLSIGAPSTCIAKEALAEVQGIRLLEACTV